MESKSLYFVECVAHQEDRNCICNRGIYTDLNAAQEAIELDIIKGYATDMSEYICISDDNMQYDIEETDDYYAVTYTIYELIANKDLQSYTP